MGKVYFTSDLHFGHKSLCEGLRKMSAEESDNIIITNWNKLITNRDKVYILGDISMEDTEHLDKILLLKGNKVVVAGNHDTEKCCRYLSSIGIEVMGCLHYKGFICTHVPIHPLELAWFRGNIHGHLHKAGDIEGLGHYESIVTGEGYYNVNTEFHNYTPVPFEKIAKKYDAETMKIEE